MFGKSITLFRLLGFDIKVDLSWVLIALLITWSLATSFFPSANAGFPVAVYWWMGVAGALGLFTSIVLHELSHSVVARRFGIPIRGITLFIFGGVAEMEEEPPSPRAEFLMAIAGPAASIGLAFAFHALALLLVAAGVAAPLAVVSQWLGFINAVLAVFNMVPAFPLDGGRAFRAVLWYRYRDLRRATRVASNVGSIFGLFLIAFGVYTLLTGNIVGGIWAALIGMFLRGAAAASYMQMITRRALEGEPVRRFMTPHPVTVPPDISLTALVEDYMYRSYHQLYPVTEDGRLLGCIGAAQVKNVPREQWSSVTVRQALERRGPENTIDADTDTVRALSRMRRTGRSRLLVTERGDLVGIITLKDIMRLLSLRMDLEGME
jgi:Zn-dependent protease